MTPRCYLSLCAQCFRAAPCAGSPKNVPKHPVDRGKCGLLRWNFRWNFVNFRTPRFSSKKNGMTKDIWKLNRIKRRVQILFYGWDVLMRCNSFRCFDWALWCLHLTIPMRKLCKAYAEGHCSAGRETEIGNLQFILLMVQKSGGHHLGWC